MFKKHHTRLCSLGFLTGVLFVGTTLAQPMTRDSHPQGKVMDSRAGSLNLQCEILEDGEETGMVFQMSYESENEFNTMTFSALQGNDFPLIPEFEFGPEGTVRADGVISVYASNDRVSRLFLARNEEGTNLTTGDPELLLVRLFFFDVPNDHGEILLCEDGLEFKPNGRGGMTPLCDGEPSPVIFLNCQTQGENRAPYSAAR